MPVPRYDHLPTYVFGGLTVEEGAYERAQAVVLPIPLERTTSYVPGTRNGPREILLASTQMELWDEEMCLGAATLDICTLPEMELPFGTLEEALAEVGRVAGEIVDAGKFLAALGGEHSITPGIVASLARRAPGLSVLQIDAHADLRDGYLGNPYSHASAIRRVLDHARCTQVGIRSLSEEEAAALASLPVRTFFDFEMRNDPAWMDRVVESLGDPVYLTIDCDGLDPAIMPAVGTPEPGGLSWKEALALLRKLFASRTVIGCDIVELSPIPGLVAPNFLCARLLYKILLYRLARGSRKP
jgi:agmatinase